MDIDVSDVTPERVPDVKKLVRAKRAKYNKLLQKYGVHVWNKQQQYHVSFALLFVPDVYSVFLQ